jgi:hypothetical protein
LRPLLVLGQPPVWAKPQREVRNWWEPCFPGHELCAGEAAYRAKRPAGNPIWGGVPDLAAWRRYVAAVANRWPTAMLQVWNEPNIDYFGLPSPRNYKRLLRGAVKEAGNRRVVGAGLSPTEERNQGRVGFIAYARALRRLGIAKVDHDVAIHTFPGYVGGTGTVRTARRAYGKRTRLWVTEVGVSNAKRSHAILTPDQERWQALAMRRFMRRTRWVRATIVYRLNDHPDGVFWGDQGMGLLRANLTPKPVLGAVRRATW